VLLQQLRQLADARRDPSRQVAARLAVPFFGSMMSPKAQREDSMAWTTPVLVENLHRT
jgi:hypothetical protein